MSVNPRLPYKDKQTTLLSQIVDSVQAISRDLSYEFGPFKVQKIKPLKIISDSPEVVQLKKQNRLLFITMIATVSTTIAIGVIDIILRLCGK